MINESTISQFRQTVWDYYDQHGRHGLPWRQLDKSGTFDPYHILVSEIMLQQTQVGRVIPKYQTFLKQFPTLSKLGAAPQGDVLRAWSGLGYNRRARFLQQTAQQIRTKGLFPDQLKDLVTLPGVGPNTAGAILAYAFNRPVVFIETNLRTAFIHHFFNDQSGISDKQLIEVATIVLDEAHPRQWYWALTDYGAYLKLTQGNLNRQSKAYTKQTAFAGSKRQIRGQILRLLQERNVTLNMLSNEITDARLEVILDELMTEELIHRVDKAYSL